MTDFVSWWGAGLATVLASIKIYETYRDSKPLEISYSFDSRPDVGNKIFLINPSKNPIIIAFYELLWGNSKKSAIGDLSPEEIEPYSITIPAFAKHELVFRDMEHFSWGKDCENLYIKLVIAGRRKPIIKLVAKGK